MAKLINYQYVKIETDISQNVPETELDIPIKRSQEMLEMVIGPALVAELVSEYPNFSTANVTLMTYTRYIYPCPAVQIKH